MKHVLLSALVFFFGVATFAQETSNSSSDVKKVDEPTERKAPPPVVPSNTPNNYGESNGYLRPRDHSLYWRLSSASLEIDEIDSSTVEGSFSYGRNFGTFEPFISYSFNSEEEEDAETRWSMLEIGARIHFVPNFPGNDVVPYAMFALGLYSEKAEFENNPLFESVEGRGTPYSLGVGLLWYPFSELIAVDVSLGFVSGDMDLEVDDVDFGDVDVTLSGFNIGFVLSF